jgi:hypothetical protein
MEDHMNWPTAVALLGYFGMFAVIGYGIIKNS